MLPSVHAPVTYSFNSLWMPTRVLVWVKTWMAKRPSISRAIRPVHYSRVTTKNTNLDPPSLDVIQRLLSALPLSVPWQDLDGMSVLEYAIQQCIYPRSEAIAAYDLQAVWGTTRRKTTAKDENGRVFWIEYPLVNGVKDMIICVPMAKHNDQWLKNRTMISHSIQTLSLALVAEEGMYINGTETRSCKRDLQSIRKHRM